jgi:hypothetical protein
MDGGVSGDAGYLSARVVSEQVKEEAGIKINERRITDAYHAGRVGESPLQRWLPLTLNFSFELFLATSSI